MECGVRLGKERYICSYYGKGCQELELQTLNRLASTFAVQLCGRKELLDDYLPFLAYLAIALHR